ncbi:hypothetical protein SUGI_0489200 [Cryptomeria japonica]|nr:hypothetical protein SUGI_0489200 [Cryptomeria japonica]
MGGLLNLFDFNQPHNGRKFLTDKRHSDGLEAPRNSLDVSLETSHTGGIKNEDIPYAYEMKKIPSTRKKTSGMPIKTLIAQEMLKETDSKRRTPSVVARLMGLDAMPGESVSAQHIKSAEIHPQKKIFGKQQQEAKSSHDVHFFQRKSKGKASKPPQEQCLPNPSQDEMDNHYQRTSLGTRPFRDHPQEHQLQEFKKQFAAWQASKFQDHSTPRQPDEINRKLSEKQALLHEKLNEAKMALVRDKFIDAKRLATDEKLQQSKEFLDALEVLQLNKDMFLKFLQDPNSLFAKNTQNIQSNLGTEEEQLPKMKSLSPAKRREMWREKDHRHTKISKEGNKNEKRLQRQKGHKFFSEREDVQHVRTLSPDISLPVCTMHEQKDNYPSMSSDSKKNSSSLPTRIVVLKPGPGRPHNYRMIPSPSCSPHSQTELQDSEVRETRTTQDFLQEVRERLKLSFAEKKKDDSRIIEEGVQDQLCNGHKDPRHIAQQIARQVRESVTRDLGNDMSQVGDISMLSSFTGKKSLPSRSTNTTRDADIGSCTEISVSDAIHSWEHANRSNPPVSSSISKPSDLPKYENNEPRKTMPGRRRTTQWEEEEQKLRQQQLRQISYTLGQVLSIPGNKKHVSQANRHQQNNRGSAGDAESDISCCDMHESGSKFKKSIKQEIDAKQEGFSADINVNDYKGASPWSPAAKNFESINSEGQNNASCVNPSSTNEIGPDRPGNSLPAESIKFRVEKSSFKGKVSNLKDSLLRGRKSSSKKMNCADTGQPNNCIETHPNNGCDLHHEAPSNSNRLETSDDLHVLCPQEICMPSVDCHYADVATKLLESSPCSTHRTLTKDDKGSEQCLMDTLNLISASAKDKNMLSGTEIECAVKENLPGDDVQITPSCRQMEDPPLGETNTSENIEKVEHPSPVSVLELPFQEQSPSLNGFEKISSNLQELRLRLRLLKFDDSEKIHHESENLSQGETTVLEDRDIEVAGTDSENTCTSSSETEHSPAPGFPFPEIENVDIISMMIKHIPCPETQSADLLYVINALVASGFSGNADTVFSQWHSPSNPMDPSLYKKLQGNEHGKSDSVCEMESYRSESEEKLLFDCINEVLLEILGPFFNPRPWVKLTKWKYQQHMPVGNQLLEETWLKLSYYLYQQSDMEYTLDNIVGKDLDRDNRWLELQDDVEMVGVELDKMIFDNLIEEVCCDLLST